MNVLKFEEIEWIESLDRRRFFHKMVILSADGFGIDRIQSSFVNIYMWE
jgi:hypothetical protein